MQNEYFGNGSLIRLQSILEAELPKKVLIVSGIKSYVNSGAQKQIESLLAEFEWYRHYGFKENPRFSELIKGAKVAKHFAPDLIIAVGGGSVLDTAKIIAIIPEDESGAKSIITGEAEPEKKIAPIVAIPTTSGSGSEATHFAVAYIDNTKYSVGSMELLADHVIIDPVLTYTMSPYQTAVSGMDALCQGIESYWSNRATEKSEKYSLEAIDIILKNLEQAVNNPTSSTRLEMAKGSNLAGKAINITKTTAPHALSYGITMNFGIPHGHAVGLTLGEFIVLNTSKAFSSGDNVLLNKMNKIFNLFNSDEVIDSKDRFYHLMQNIGLETNLGKLGLTDKKNINVLVESVNEDRLQNHPASISKQDIYKVLEKIS